MEETISPDGRLRARLRRRPSPSSTEIAAGIGRPVAPAHHDVRRALSRTGLDTEATRARGSGWPRCRRWASASGACDRLREIASTAAASEQHDAGDDLLLLRAEAWAEAADRSG